MERIAKAFINLIIVLLVGTLFMVNFICVIYRIILQEWTNCKLCRPAKIVNGDYGPIIFPNTGDVEALKAFIYEQCELARKATKENDVRRIRHHMANMILALKDPMAVLNKSRSKFGLQTYQFIQRHIERYTHNCQWRV